MNREGVKPRLEKKNQTNTTQQTRRRFFFEKQLDLKHLGQVEDKQALGT